VKRRQTKDEVNELSSSDTDIILHTIKRYMKSRGISLPFVILYIARGWINNLTSRPLCAWGNTSLYPLNGKLDWSRFLS